MICVPGGFGVGAAIRDAETLAFVRAAGQSARYVTSVCTGAFLLGAAGLLRGRRATTHWAYHHLLPLVGAIPQHGRVVRDGDVFTGGGVTAGIDFALTVAAELASPQAAQRIQLTTEYDPEPPFAAGSPDRAPVEVSDELKAFFAVRTAEFKNEISAALAAA
jgi:cyclohexyl-isocyanide hydratase